MEQILGLLSFLFIGFYIMIAKNRPFMDAFILSGCVGVSSILWLWSSQVWLA